MGTPPAPGGAADHSSKGRARNRAVLAFVVGAVAVSAVLGASTTGAQAENLPYAVTTDFAVAQVAKPAYVSPSTHAKVLKGLSFFTPDHEALQTYRFVKSQRVKNVLWEEIDVPMRPNGQTGWVERSWLGPVQTVHTLVVVDIATESLAVYNRGKQIFTAPVGTGHQSDPTWPTPSGHYWIAEEFPSKDAFYGPWAFGTTDYATDTDFPDGSIVGIHGTNEPWLIPGDPSHGCVRLKDADILKLKTLVGIGTPVWILPPTSS
jgi:lipoprotein-anchoring transpeptidase ErfK/SrfK